MKESSRKPRIALRFARDEAMRRAHNAAWYARQTEGRAAEVWCETVADYVREARELNHALLRTRP